jgi:bifunctional non-homologous end joining protein LigD
VGKLPRIAPDALSLVAAAFDNPDWIFEIKHDGFRALAYISDNAYTLTSRKYSGVTRNSLL